MENTAVLVQENSMADATGAVFWRNWRTAGLGTFLFMLGSLGLAAWYLAAGNPTFVLVRAFEQLGWGIAGVVLVRATILMINAGAWSRLGGPRQSLTVADFLVIRIVREAVNVLLPVANIGGEIVGARLLTFWAIPGPIAVASVATDFLLQSAGQALFALVGAILLIGPDIGIALACGVALAAVVLGYGMRRRLALGLEHWLRLLSKCIALANPADLHVSTVAIWRDRPGIAVAALLHAISWFLGTLEVWVVVHVLSLPVGLGECLILQSLALAIRALWFVVPGGFGVQEGGFILIGHTLGICPEAAIAISLASRVPDLVLGLPGIAAWYCLEGRRALARRS